MLKLKLRKNRKSIIAIHEDLGLVGDNYISKFIINDKEMLSECPIKDARLSGNLARFRWLHDLGFLQGLGYKLTGEFVENGVSG